MTVLERCLEDPGRALADHKNQVTTDDFAANLHWVTPKFDVLNRARRRPASGYYGVTGRTMSFVSKTATLLDPKTVGRCYDLMLRLRFGDQLVGVRGVLNDLPDQDRLVTWMAETPDGVHI